VFSVFLRVLCVLFVSLCLSGCLAPTASPDSFTFAIIGDAPYKSREEPHFERMMERIDREDVAFTIHVGDIGAGGVACSDAYYEKSLRRFERSRAPLIYTPGDNEWTDCRGARFDPLERLKRLRTIFFEDEYSLGRTKMRTEVQQDRVAECGAYPENRAWTHGRVAFVTLNVPGADNNVGHDAANDAEARARDAANARWLARSVDDAIAANAAALVILVQANPWRIHKRRDAYAPFLASLTQAARRFVRPVLFVHGDTHTYRIDAPLADAQGPVANVIRLETYGSPFVGWVQVDVDPADPQPFRIEGHLEALVPPP